MLLTGCVLLYDCISIILFTSLSCSADCIKTTCVSWFLSIHILPSVFKVTLKKVWMLLFYIKSLILSYLLKYRILLSLIFNTFGSLFYTHIVSIRFIYYFDLFNFLHNNFFLLQFYFPKRQILLQAVKLIKYYET